MLCSQDGNTSMGKRTPPKSSEVPIRSMLIGSPRLKTIMKLAESIPMLLKHIIVRTRINSAPPTLA